MRTDIAHMNENRYSVLINGEYHIGIDLDNELMTYAEELTNDERDEILQEVKDFHADRISSESEAEEFNSDPHKYFGVSPNDFI